MQPLEEKGISCYTYYVVVYCFPLRKGVYFGKISKAKKSGFLICFHIFRCKNGEKWRKAKNAKPESPCKLRIFKEI